MERQAYNNLTVASAPHLVTSLDTTRTMGYVLLALVPSFLVSTYVFGWKVILLTAVCVIASVGFEYLYNVIAHKRQTVQDLSAAVTGVLIAFNVPSSLPVWMAVVGCFVAIVIVKQLYGGLGKNVANPAIVARIVLFVSFATQMTSWPLPITVKVADATTGPTPLGILAEGSVKDLPSNMEMFLGFIGGSLGEVSAIALIIGGVFLIAKKIILPHTPIAFIGTVFVIALVYYGFSGDGNALQMAVFHICAGGVMLGAFFMATDYVTTPIMPKGKIVFGIGCGIITMAIRLWGAYPEGVSFSILLMNIMTPLIDNFFIKRNVVGGVKKNAKK
ncbi:MAG: RnfABCDGE type electron transport complex subunit D [Clostridiales bacterium]|nr:RnfABCDGE type electron transport complex subunit D [Clostridiales bacterium]MDY4061279.1 RnfABCDGE type electron transport complex subunit D [Anaerovoracaceae bacterium]